MADNVDFLTPDGAAAADEVTYGVRTDAKVQLLRFVGVVGAVGSKTVIEPPPLGRGSTPALANVSYSTSSVTLQAANADRRQLDIVNDTDRDLYVKFGTAASVTSYSLKLTPGERHREVVYSGIVTGIWTSGGSGAARMTEIAA